MVPASLAISEELGDRQGVADSYYQIGSIAHDRGRLASAEEWYRRSLAISEELGNRPYVAGTLGQLGLLAEERGQLSEALAWMVRSVALFETFPHPATRSQYRST